MNLIRAATALLLAAASALAAPYINTPTSIVECQPSILTFGNGTAPYYISIIPGGEPSGTALETLETQDQAGTLTWTCDIASGTSISFSVKDSTGAINYSDAVTIQAGSSSSCLGSNSASAITSTSTSTGTAGTSTLNSASGSSSRTASSTTRSSSSATMSSSRASAASASASAASPADRVAVNAVGLLLAALAVALW